MENEVKETFIIEDENGVTHEAEIITMLGIEDRDYLIYSIPNDIETVTICASKVVKNESGEDVLVDLEAGSDKDKITEFIRDLAENN